MKWAADQRDGILGWTPPARKGESEQPRWEKAWVDLDEAFADPQTSAVLEAWMTARAYEAPAYSGGVLDAWPALMVDGLAVCRQEAMAVDEWRRHLEERERHDGPEPSTSR